MADNNPISISLEPDKSALEAWKQASQGIVKPAELNQALVLATNRALASARTEAIKQAMAQYTIKRKDLLESIHTRPASTTKLHAELRFTGPRIPLIKFVVKPTVPMSRPGMPRTGRPPLFVKIRKDGGGPAEGLFVAKLGKEPGVYKRKGPERFPLSKETGPSVVSMVGNETAVNAIQERARQILDQRIDHEMRRLLSK